MLAAVKPAIPAEMITATLGSALIRNCKDDERHLEVRIGNVERATGRRQVFGAVAKTDTALITLTQRSLNTVGRTESTLHALHCGPTQSALPLPTPWAASGRDW